MILIENGYVMDPRSAKEGLADVWIKEDKIVRIGENLRSEMTEEELLLCQIIDAGGKVIAPGLVDVHVHFRDPGFTHKEDIHTGAVAAAKGGFTTVVLMANVNPHVDNLDTLKYVLDKGASTGIHVETCANVTMGMKGAELVDMKALAEAGAAGFTDDGVPLMDEELVREAMKQSAAAPHPSEALRHP